MRNTAPPQKRNVAWRTAKHAFAGRVGFALPVSLALHATDAGPVAYKAAEYGIAAATLLGGLHGYRSATNHNKSLVTSLATAKAHRQTMTGAVRNAQFEAKHRRIHGKFT